MFDLSSEPRIQDHCQTRPLFDEACRPSRIVIDQFYGLIDHVPRPYRLWFNSLLEGNVARYYARRLAMRKGASASVIGEQLRAKLQGCGAIARDQMNMVNWRGTLVLMTGM